MCVAAAEGGDASAAAPAPTATAAPTPAGGSVSAAPVVSVKEALAAAAAKPAPSAEPVRKPSAAGGAVTVPAGQKSCHTCQKVVYEMEQITYDKMIFHKNCFKCLSFK